MEQVIILQKNNPFSNDDEQFEMGCYLNGLCIYSVFITVISAFIFTICFLQQKLFSLMTMYQVLH